MTKQKQGSKNIPYNVLNSKAGKVTIASTLLSGIGVTDAIELIMPDEIGKTLEVSAAAAPNKLEQTSTESTSRTQTQTFTIPNMKVLNNVIAKNGNVEIVRVDGDQVTVRMTNGPVSKRVETGGSYTPEDSIYVTGQTSSAYNNGGYSGTLSQYLHSGSYTPTETKQVTGQTSSSYNSGGYSGTLSQYLYSGSYTPADSKTATGSRSMSYEQEVAGGSLPSSISYNSGGYSGTLYGEGVVWDHLGSFSQKYSGTVTKPASDTRVYRYEGTVTKPASDTRQYRYQGNVTKPAIDTRTYDTYYQYNLIFDYEIDSTGPTINLTPSKTEPTNTTIFVDVHTSDESGVKKVKWEKGNHPASYFTTAGNLLTENSFEVAENDVYTVYAIDTMGNESIQTIDIGNIDKTAPVITISGIEDGETYVNEATPSYEIDDSNEVTAEVLLNGETFAGGKVTDSGSYIYTVTGTDAAGNDSTETKSFHVNHTPRIIETVDNKIWSKFTKETINLTELFADTENDDLTYKVTSSNPNNVSVTLDGSSLDLEALMQGNSTITITTQDKYSESEAIIFEIGVESSAPVLTFTKEETKIVGKDDSVSIEGTILDADKEDVTVTVSLGDVTKSEIISTSGEEDSWSIEFMNEELSTGVYPISVEAKDPYGAEANLTSIKYIIKLPGATEEYEPTLNGYENDLTKDRQDFTQTEHQVLLDAYIAVEGLTDSNSPDAWLLVKPKIDALADGTVKEGFYRVISGKAFEYLVANFATATKSDYETAAINHIQDALVSTYNEKNLEYLLEKGEFIHEDVQLMIDIVNATDKAQISHIIEDWKVALDLINQLDNGSVKVSYLQDVEDGLIKSIELTPSKLTKDVVETLLNISVQADREMEYQLYLVDVLAVEGTLTKTILQNVIDTVDGVSEQVANFENNPTQDNLTAFQVGVAALVDGVYKTNNTSELPSMNLSMVIHDPAAMTEVALDTIGVTYNVNHLSLYQDFLRAYLEDIPKEDVTKEVLQLIIDVVNAVEEVKADPTDENIQKANDLLAGLDPNAKVVSDTKQIINSSILEQLNKDFTKVTEKQLENLGIENIVSENLSDYQTALDEYAKEHDPNDLTVDDIQKVINAINAVKNARANPSSSTIKLAYDAVNLLDNGGLKDRLLQEIEDIAIDYIVNNPGSITAELLKHANIVIDSNVLIWYKAYLQDVLPDKPAPVTKEHIQEVINEVDTVWTAYHKAIKEPSKAHVLNYETLVDELSNGAFKTNMVAFIDDVALAYLVVSPSTQEKDDYARMGISINEENISSYNINIAKYIRDIGAASFSVTEVSRILNVTNKVEIALADSSTANVQQALQDVRNLANGQLKADLTASLNGQVIGNINLDPSTVTAQDLINLGIQRVNPDLEKEYQDALVKLKNDMGGTLTFEGIQDAVDAVNAVDQVLKTKNSADLNTAIDAINQLPDGSLKEDLFSKIKDVVKENVLENPSDLTTEKLIIGGFDNVDDTLEDSYKEHLLDYIQPLTDEAVQQIIDIVNQVKKTRLDLLLDDRNTLSEMVKNLAESNTKNNLTKVYDALNQLYSTEQSFNLNNVQESFDLASAVTTGERAYLEQMAKSFSHVLTTLMSPSDESVALAQAELVKLENGQLKTRFQERVGGAYLEHVITSPGSSNFTDWVNAGFENLVEENFPLYKAAVENIKNEVGSLTKEQIQAIIDAINAMELAKKNPTNASITTAKEKIQIVVNSTLKDKWLEEMDALWKSIQPKPPVVNPTPPVNDGKPDWTNDGYENIVDGNIPQYEDAVEKITDEVGQLTKDQIQAIVDAINAMNKAKANPNNETIQTAKDSINKVVDSKLKVKWLAEMDALWQSIQPKPPVEDGKPDWTNGGYENIVDSNIPQYEDAIEKISDEVGQLTKEQIQAIVDAINAMNKAKANPSNETIQVARDAINKVVASTLKEKWLAEMDALWQSIQPIQPQPPVVSPPVTPTPPEKPSITLPSVPNASDKLMVAKTAESAVVLELMNKEVAVNEEVKMKIKVTSLKDVKGSKLTLYAKPKSNSVSRTAFSSKYLTASQTPMVLGVSTLDGFEAILEIDLMDLINGTYEGNKSIKFAEEGDFEIKAVFSDVTNSKEDMETNAVEVEVFTQLDIPNTVLPNPHGLPVATLKAIQDIPVYEMNAEGKFERSGSLKKDSLHHVQDTEKGYYKLSDGRFIKPGNGATVHIGKGEVRKDSVNVYDKNGRFLRTIKKGQQYKVYAYDSKRYNIGGGEYIELQDGITYVFGWFTVNQPMTLYKSNGTAERTLNKGEKYRIYSADAEYLHVGGGYKIKRDLSKFTFLKN